MRKTVSVLLAVLLLAALTTGCDLRNRRPSSEFIPVTEPTEPTEPTQLSEPEPTEAPTVETTVVMQVTVRDVLVKDGSYTDRYGNTYDYMYHVPYIDAEAKYAQGCNREIDQRFGSEVTAALHAMEDGSTLGIVSVDYMTRLRDDFLTLYITMKSADGEQTKAVYTLDRHTGEAVDNLVLLQSIGLDEERFLELAEETIRNYFEETYGDYTWDDMVRYNTAKDRTMNPVNYTLEMPMFLNESDELVIVATIYDLAGGKHNEQLIVTFELEPEET